MTDDHGVITDLQKEYWKIQTPFLRLWTRQLPAAQTGWAIARFHCRQVCLCPSNTSCEPRTSGECGRRCERPANRDSERAGSEAIGICVCRSLSLCVCLRVRVRVRDIKPTSPTSWRRLPAKWVPRILLISVLRISLFFRSELFSPCRRPGNSHSPANKPAIIMQKKN